MSAPKPHWLCRLFGHSFAAFDDHVWCRRCSHKPAAAHAESEPESSPSLPLAEHGAICPEPRAIVIRSGDGVIVRAFCAQCACSSFAHVLPHAPN